MEYSKEHCNIKIEMEPYSTEIVIDEIVNEIKKAEGKLGCELVSVINEGDRIRLELNKVSKEKFSEFDVNKDETKFAAFLLFDVMQRIVHLSKTQRQRFYEIAKGVLHIDIDSFKVIEDIARRH
jgi:hypothetical protein